MHRIDGAGATDQNLFTEGSPASGVPATTVTEEWLNDVQEEVCNIVEAAGLTLEKGTRTQLLEAISHLSGRVVANKAELVALLDALQATGTLTAAAGRKIFVASDDGGAGTIKAGAAAGTYASNGGDYCGTQSLPTGGDGSAAWTRSYNGYVDPTWFGLSDAASATVNAAAITAAVAVGAVAIPKGTFACDPLSFAGFDNLTIVGHGRDSVLDFAGAADDGLYVGYSVEEGGCKHVTLRDFAVTDSGATSSVPVMINIEGGPTGQTPSQTVGFCVLDNVRYLQYNNTAGTALRLRNLSHVRLVEVKTAYQMGCQDGLVIDDNENINTGVISAYNCYFNVRRRALHLRATQALLDTFDVRGNFFGNYPHAAVAGDAVVLEADGAAIYALTFEANHIEARTATDGAHAAVRVTGTSSFGASSLSNNHISAGTADQQCLYGIQFDGTGALRALAVDNNEFLRIDDAGACVRFENTPSVDVINKISVTGVFRNSTAAAKLSIATGGNEDAIWNGLRLESDEIARLATIDNDTALSITPPHEDGVFVLLANNQPQSSAVIAYRAHAAGAACGTLGAGGNVETTTGALAGTTGTGNKITVSAHTDEKIYIENRLGFAVQLTWKFLHSWHAQ